MLEQVTMVTWPMSVSSCRCETRRARLASNAAAASASRPPVSPFSVGMTAIPYSSH